jgi:hypothetical protein
MKRLFLLFISIFPILLHAQQYGDSCVLLEDSCYIHLDEAAKEKQDTLATVIFQSTPNTKYDVDQYPDVYSKVTEFYKTYKQSNSEMAASAKFMVPGVSDEIFVRVVGSD